MVNSLIEAERSVADFFGSLSPEEFVFRDGSAWNPAEHLSHLNTAISAVARGFGIPRWILRLRFGRSKRPSRDFAIVRQEYLARLSAGAVARGAFVPPREDPLGDDRVKRQRDLLERWQRVNARLRNAVETWPQRDLDRLQLPHPLLGKVTAREMLFVMMYHDHHHIAGAKKRLPRFSASTRDGSFQ